MDPPTAARPTTARPRTAAHPAANHSHGWVDNDNDSYDDDDDDEDVGMFSFARPTTGEQHNALPRFDHAQHQPAFPSSSDPFTPNPFSFAAPAQHYEPYSSSTQAYPSRPSTAVAPALSPAAAYALENASPVLEGPRKRTSFSAPDSPNYVVGNPYEQQWHDQRRSFDDLGQGSSQSSRDKIEALDPTWADQRNVSYALRPDGQAIMLDEMGEPLRMATSREQKMLEDVGLPDFVPYRTDPPDHEEAEEDSPYPEVRASVSNIDDPEMPVLTLRMWFMGFLFCIIISAVNMFFSLRYPAPLITPLITQIFSYPLGKFLAHFLPIAAWTVPRWLRKFGAPSELSLNPGPFNIKEHTLLVIMANVSTGPSYALSLSLASEKFYKLPSSVGFDILVVLTTQMIGFGVAGLCRRFLVWPAAMIWPQNLVFCTLLNTLHAEDDDASGGTTRLRFFIYAFCGAFAWYWLPGFLFVALSAFSWVCWIAPNNVVVNQLFGVSSGLGMGLFTFDWSQIAYIGSPLVVPWWAEVNIFAGFAIAFWIIAPIMYYTNVWDSAYLPISTSQVFDRFGAPYNTSAVIDPLKLSLNVTAYEEYSPLYLPITYATVYGVAFMLATSVVVHTALTYGKTMVKQLRRIDLQEDVHMKLMKYYPEVPEWWYMIFLATAFGLSCATLAAFEHQTPVWAIVIAILIGCAYLVPGGVVYALTSQQISINLIVELIAGYMFPGQAIANMAFKTYAGQTLITGLLFVQDLKLGHYMKIPPRATFTVQIVATAVTAFVQVGVKRWLVGVVPDLCDEQQAAFLTCPNARVFYSASIIWGLIGPERQFAIGQLYNPILYWLLAGAIAPVVVWLLARRFPRSFLQYANVPVALSGCLAMPPATGINYSSWFLVGFVFQYLLRQRRFEWWSKFNFVLSAALDAGTVVSGIVIFLAVMLPKHGTISLDWWGNNVFTNTLDWAGASYRTPPLEGFGRTTW
ncbi:hypothetical protein JCM10212_002673 [Sporobolomyces blumeae]